LDRLNQEKEYQELLQKLLNQLNEKDQQKLQRTFTKNYY
jgi:hypothetical protein